MDELIKEREALWPRILQSMPLESLPNLILNQYTKAGDQHCIVYSLAHRESWTFCRFLANGFAVTAICLTHLHNN